MEFTILYTFFLFAAIGAIFGLGYIIGTFFEKKRSEERIQEILQKPITNPIRREFKQ